MQRLTFFVVLVVIPFLAQAQAEDYLYQGYIKSSQTLLKTAVDHIKKSPERNDLRLLEAYYLLLNNTMRDNDEETFDLYVDDAEKLAKQILKKNPQQVEASGILGAIYGLKIAYSPMKGMFLGGKSSSLSEAGIQSQADHPVGHLFFAMNKHNTPEMWGGDPVLALEHFRKSVQIFEEKNQKAKNWYYLYALAWLGIAENKAGNTPAARVAFEKALAVEPGYTWVRSMTTRK
ncbi:MAG: hypothetical protein ACFCUI_06480 [Bernardetiaceae bacterium]